MFPFNQPPSEEGKPSRDCGYRCMYWALSRFLRWGESIPYSMWLDQFRFFQPVQSGILFNDICTVLDHYKLDFRFTHLTDIGFYLIYSGIWLSHETPPKKHGHYFIYDDGVVYCSTRSEPYRLGLEEVHQRLEAKTLDGAFRCLKVLGVKD